MRIGTAFAVVSLALAHRRLYNELLGVSSQFGYLANVVKIESLVFNK
ncbi:hypothetical protein F-VV57_0211 [Faustovirus]|nr:hypothetical protein F-VV57_0211 [Faustovirus]QJX73478.1 hypothetical protein F-VV63_0212 [Faustovirus]